nr:hypothetical protein [Tanacetum cinerariifolium]
PGPEEPEQAPPSPDYVPSLEHADDEIEEEHPAPADSVVVAPTAADQALSAEETEPFETDESTATPPPHPAYRTMARICILAPVPKPAWTDSEVARLLAISSPPASPLSPWSSPPPQIPFPPLPPILSPPSPILSPAPPPSPIQVRYRSWSQIRGRGSSSTAAARPARGFRVDYGFVATVDREIMRGPEREEADCDFRVTEDRSYEIYRDFRVEDNLTGTDHSLTGIVTALQAYVTTLQGQQRLAGDPTQPELPEEAGGSA